jgi:hypothetical protein
LTQLPGLLFGWAFPSVRPYCNLFSPGSTLNFVGGAVLFSLETEEAKMIRKLKSGEFRLYSRKKDESTGKRRNLGTFGTLEKAKQHEREVQYFKKH